jgi:hypothetical protein
MSKIMKRRDNMTRIKKNRCSPAVAACILPLVILVGFLGVMLSSIIFPLGAEAQPLLPHEGGDSGAVVKDDEQLAAPTQRELRRRDGSETGRVGHRRDFRGSDVRGGDARGDFRGKRSEREHVVRLARFVRFMNDYQQAIQEPHGAVSFAAMGLKQHYKKIGKPLEVVPELEKMLDACKASKTRNVLLFTIRQIYEEQGDEEKVLMINRRILSENVGLF